MINITQEYQNLINTQDYPEREKLYYEQSNQPNN